MALFSQRAPGVYVYEEPAYGHPITPVGTSTAAFIGKAPYPGAPKEPVLINSWLQFVRTFLYQPARDDTGKIIEKNKEGKRVGRKPDDDKNIVMNVAQGAPLNETTPLASAVYGFFLNGGARCYVVNIGNLASLKSALEQLEPIDEVAIVAAPGYTTKTQYTDLIAHCEQMADRVAILDAPDPTKIPADVTKLPVSSDGENGIASQDGFATYYFPWLTIGDPINLDNGLITVPPSGFVAGIWARTDATRGVHKAPANESVRGAVGLTHNTVSANQAVMNDNGVNVIRAFRRDGILVWGARTLAASSSEWKYLSVRRLFNMIEESIQESMRWAVFEPNDEFLWKTITRDVTAFLTIIWRGGALMGTRPQDAFFVKCDAETNTSDTIDQGMVITIVGIAPVKPAEFVIFRIQQTAGRTEVESNTQGGS